MHSKPMARSAPLNCDDYFSSGDYKHHTRKRVELSEMVGGNDVMRGMLKNLRLNRSIRIPLFVLLLGLVGIGSVACSRATLTIEQKTPLTINLSGYETVQFIQVASQDGAIWRISPKEPQSLSDMHRIVYGEVPVSCWQTIPKNEPPPPFREGVTYSATAVIFDSAPVTARFTIRDGKIEPAR
jgi:hypothetical protein